ncbi:MAG: hypothetical protein OYL92_15820 [Acidobacteriota bacterium]|nr:hypothetical protein [Acidobacteriota bacterium]MDE3266436.1 hypothetical protein [Acidobacteriota bacterium]
MDRLIELLPGLTAAAALLIAIGNWIFESRQRRKRERERRIDLKRALYAETARTLEGFVMRKSNEGAVNFFQCLAQLQMTAPVSVVEAAYQVMARTFDDSKPEVEIGAIDALINAMREDLGDEPVVRNLPTPTRAK